LTERTATRLATTLALVHNLHGLDAQEGLAFLVQLYLLSLEQYRASQGQQSLLFDAKWLSYGTSFEDFWHCLPAITDSPFWDLLEVLDFWTYFGAQVPPGVMYGRDHAEGRLWHLMIPPIWVSLEKLRSLSDQHAESLKIPMLVPPTLKALTEHFIGFYSLHAQTQGPLSLTFQPAERGNHKDDSAPLGIGDCDLKHTPDYRSVNWRGEDLSFTPDQAIIIKALHEAYKNGTPDVGQRHLFKQADRQSDRLRDLFRSKHAKDIWGRFVIPGKTRGTYRLNLP